ARAATDYLAQSGTLHFAAGETQQTFRVPLLDNGFVEGNKTVNVTLSSPSGGAVLGLQPNALLTIRDNEIPARLLDIHFQPDTPVSSLSVALQSDGKILLAGFFYAPNVGDIWKIVRLNPDGSRDPQFEYTGHAVALAPGLDGKVLIAGSFTKVGAVARNGIAR